MDEQLTEQAGAPAKLKNETWKMIMINVIFSAIVSFIVSYIVVMVMAGPLTVQAKALANRVSTLEQQLAKITSVYHVGK
jgi:hypothetical protein